MFLLFVPTIFFRFNRTDAEIMCPLFQCIVCSFACAVHAQKHKLVHYAYGHPERVFAKTLENLIHFLKFKPKCLLLIVNDLSRIIAGENGDEFPLKR